MRLPSECSYRDELTAKRPFRPVGVTQLVRWEIGARGSQAQRSATRHAAHSLRRLLGCSERFQGGR